MSRRAQQIRGKAGPVGFPGQPQEASHLERVLRHDRVVIALVLGVLTLLSWAQMVSPFDSSFGAKRLMPCCSSRFGIAFSMWVVMMAGMMIPSVAPMVLAHAAIMRRRVTHGAPFVSSGLFLGGYLLSWTGFSAIAALAQVALHRGALLDGRSLSIGPWAGGVVLLVAALFQLSHAKNACLSQCRAPLGYFMTEWREGHAGAVEMGLRHGILCVGCCWLLMVVLFAVGIMNILWGAVITLFVAAEKVLPWRRAIVWSGSAICLSGSTVLLYRAVAAI